MPTPVQAKLLRLLQEGTFRRLGDPVERRVDLRIVAATNADLPALIAARRFRQDLFYRLQTLELPLPPLRERGEDLDALIWLFAARALGRARGAVPETARDGTSGGSARAVPERASRGAMRGAPAGTSGGPTGGAHGGTPGAAPGETPPTAPGNGSDGLTQLFDSEVLEALRRYPWPGNVRELEAMTRRLALMAAHAGRATIEMLPPAIARWRGRPSGVRRELSLARHLERAERELIAETLTLVDGNRTAAARTLGISRNALYKKMARLGIRIPA
jgi:transcriptional regulator with PAS, ATPase and Fis domain